LGLNRVVLREQVKEVLLARILDGVYAPGDRLVETQLAGELGVSQAPVREALRELEMLRFVVSEPFKGTRVRGVSREEVVEIYPVRAALEGLAARLAAQRLDGDVGPLRDLFEAMLGAAEDRNLHEQVALDVDFHRRIVEAAGNRALFETWASLRIEARTLITFLKADMDLLELAKTHRPVLEALADRDPARADASLRQHVEAFGELVRLRGDE
jgi:DNA-binding GntR family transcriptional regulator